MKILLLLFLTGCFPTEDYETELLQTSKKNAYLRAHKKHVPEIEYDDDIDRNARAWADLLADRCDGVHFAKDHAYRQNIHQSWGVRKLAPRDIVELWEIDKRAVKVGCNEVSYGK
jgi:hypothetical protein